EVGAAVPFVGGAVEVAALDVVQRRRAEGQRRLSGILRAANDVDVGRVVGPGGGGDGAVVEEALVDRQHLAGGGGHEHDVHEPLPDDLADAVTVLGQGAVADLAG